MTFEAVDVVSVLVVDLHLFTVLRDYGQLFAVISGLQVTRAASLHWGGGRVFQNIRS